MVRRFAERLLAADSPRMTIDPFYPANACMGAGFRLLRGIDDAGGPCARVMETRPLDIEGKSR